MTRDYYLVWTSHDEGNYWDDLAYRVKKIKPKKKKNEKTSNN